MAYRHEEQAVRGRIRPLQISRMFITLYGVKVTPCEVDRRQ